MAEAKLDMSLDDIIKQSEKKRDSKPRPASTRTRVQPRRNGSRGGSAPRVLVVPRPQGGVTKRAPTNLSVTVVNRPGDRRGAPRHPATRKFINPRSAATAAAPRGNIDGRWQHDLYSEGPSRPSRAAPRADGAKLLISNLDYNVSDDDIRELFSTVGPLKTARITYDRSGRSEGTAEVIFHSRVDAVSAQSKYNNVLLDGKRMVIEIEGPQESSGNVFSRLSDAPRSRTGGLQMTRTFQQATRGGGSDVRSARLPATGRMRGFQDDDVMEE